MSREGGDALVRWFAIAAIVYGLLGLALGLHMAIGKDHGQMPTHAHVNLIGWVSFLLFALYYRAFSAGVSPLLARVHFWLAQLSAPGMFLGIGLIYAGNAAGEGVAAVFSIGYTLSFVAFAAAALPGLLRPR